MIDLAIVAKKEHAGAEQEILVRAVFDILDHLDDIARAEQIRRLRQRSVVIDPDTALGVDPEGARRMVWVYALSPNLRDGIRQEIRKWFERNGLSIAKMYQDWPGLFFAGHPDILIPFHIAARAADCDDIRFDFLMIGGKPADPDASEVRNGAVVAELLRYANADVKPIAPTASAERVEGIDLVAEEEALNELLRRVAPRVRRGRTPGTIRVRVTANDQLWPEKPARGIADKIVLLVDSRDCEISLRLTWKHRFALGGYNPLRYEIRAPRDQWHLWLEMLLVGLLVAPGTPT